MRLERKTIVLIFLLVMPLVIYILRDDKWNYFYRTFWVALYLNLFDGESKSTVVVITIILAIIIGFPLLVAIVYYNISNAIGAYAMLLFFGVYKWMLHIEKKTDGKDWYDT